MKKMKAFTLAEVLIALTVIGIVSALTIPTLVQKTNKQEYVSALQKAYSTLSQATQQIIAENGSPKGDEGWAENLPSVFNLYKKYLINAKECGTGTAGCMEQGIIKGLDNSNATSDWNVSQSWNAKLVLQDGMQITFQSISSSCDLMNMYNNGSNDVCVNIFVDVNGVKKPNKFGRDFFNFVVKENGLFPAGCDLDGYCIKNNGTFSQGRGCACKVLREGRMDY